MNGDQFKDLLKRCGLNQKQASEALCVSEVTISQNVNKGDLLISKSLSKKAILYAIKDAKEKLAVSLEDMNGLYNKLCIELEK